MDVDRLIEILQETNIENGNKKITVHTGGNSWEEIVDVVWCQECDQFHIISERVKDGN
jgi:hypothetical protein